MNCNCANIAIGENFCSMIGRVDPATDALTDGVVDVGVHADVFEVGTVCDRYLFCSLVVAIISEGNTFLCHVNTVLKGDVMKRLIPNESWFTTFMPLIFSSSKLIRKVKSIPTPLLALCVSLIRLGLLTLRIHLVSLCQSIQTGSEGGHIH